MLPASLLSETAKIVGIGEKDAGEQPQSVSGQAEILCKRCKKGEEMKDG